MAEVINESMGLEKEWFSEACKQTRATFPQFFDHVMHDYKHDYGTICHAVAACALAAAYAGIKDENYGGISNFQASFIMWDFIQQWLYTSNKTGLRIVNYDDMLYPQCEYKFDKVISESVWRSLQKQAKEKLKDCDHCAYEVIEHWQRIANGEIPFGYRVEGSRR